MVKKVVALMAGTILTGCASVPDSGMNSAPKSAVNEPMQTLSARPTPPEATANPDNWPKAESPAAITDPQTEKRITTLLGQMSLRQKIGQLIQADIASITPEQLREYPLGSLLAGGNSGPYGNERGSAADWDRMVREFRAVSLEPGDNGVAVPIIFGVDAVHGHNNIPGATLFPHNIGLGAAHDPELIQRIGAVTAAEIAGSGIEWTFAPTLAVPQDLRWGRTYEGYSSDPSVVASYSAAMVKGLQGDLVSGKPLPADKVAATAKHFLADGGTEKGKDQGDAKISERELIAIHNAGYPPAIDAGALTVMASFSSWNGVKNHGNKSLLTDALKNQMGFRGFVVGDWNGHGQIEGCKPTNCPQALLAGLDLYMAPDSWQGLFDSLLAQAEAGEIPEARINDAVRRILRVKYKLGLMGAAAPSYIDGAMIDRKDYAAVGAPSHLAVAREAVAKSLVLLKNSGSVLPIKPGAKVLIAGPGADSMAMQSGGWTVSWQGKDVTKADFPNGQTIGEGLVDAVKAAGGKAMIAADGSFKTRPDVAILVYGEEPYAEFQGDRAHLDYQPGKATDLAMIQTMKAKGIPVVSVFLSGRPMFVGPEMAASDAFVAAWLPGSQGAGVADVLVAQKNGQPRRDFTGTLSFAWPAGCEPGAAELFPLGFGGSYNSPPPEVEVATSCKFNSESDGSGVALYDRGLSSDVTATSGGVKLINLVGKAPNFTAMGFDVAAQEDARRLVWTGPASLTFAWPETELPENATLSIRYRINQPVGGTVKLSAPGASGAGKSVDLTSTLKLAEQKDWRTMRVPLACLDTNPLNGIAVESSGALTLEIEAMTIENDSIDASCEGPF